MSDTRLGKFANSFTYILSSTFFEFTNIKSFKKKLKAYAFRVYYVYIVHKIAAEQNQQTYAKGGGDN